MPKKMIWIETLFALLPVDRKKSKEQASTIVHRLFSLQIKERRVKAAQEWPIDIGFLSKLLGLVLAPAAARILAEISNRLRL